jgi:hypothetical protein
VRVAALVTGGYMHSATLAIALFSLVGALSWLVYVLWTFRIAGARLAVCFQALLKDAVGAALVGLPLLGARLAGLPRIGVVSAAAISTLLFAALLLRSGFSLRSSPGAHSS